MSPITVHKLRTHITTSNAINYLLNAYEPVCAYMQLIHGTIIPNGTTVSTRQEIDELMYKQLREYETKQGTSFAIYGDLPLSNKTHYMLSYIKQLISNPVDIHEKPVVFPSQTTNYMTFTQRQNYARWYKYGCYMNEPEIAPVTLYVVPDMSIGMIRKMIKTLELSDVTIFLNREDDVSEFQWKSLFNNKTRLVVVTWSVWSDFILRIDTLFSFSERGYGVERIIYDQLENLWCSPTGKEPISVKRMVSPINNIFPSRFTWYISSVFLKQVESMIHTHLLPYDMMRFIYNNYPNRRTYMERCIRMNTDLLISEYINTFDPYDFNENEDDTNAQTFLDDTHVLSGIDSIAEFYNKMQHYYNTELSRMKVFRCSFYKNIQRFIANNYGNFMNFTLGEGYVHTKKFAIQYGDDIPVDNQRVPGWIPIVFQNAIMDYIFDVRQRSTSNTGNHLQSRHCSNTGIFINRWTDIFMYIVKRLASCVSQVNHVRYYAPIQDKKVRILIQHYLYMAEGATHLSELYKHLSTFPALDTVVDFYTKESKMLINYYKLQRRRLDDDIRIRIAYYRQRLYRIIQNVQANSCPVCMEELGGPMLMMGCCQTIYHCSCIMASWELRYQHNDCAQCPYCRSLPLQNKHTCFITNENIAQRIHTIPATWEKCIMNRIFDIAKADVLSPKKKRIIWAVPKEQYDLIDIEHLNFMFYMRNICNQATYSTDQLFTADAYTLPIPNPIVVEGDDPNYPSESNSYRVVLESNSGHSSRVSSPSNASGTSSFDGVVVPGSTEIERQTNVRGKIYFVVANNGITTRMVQDEEDESGVYVYVIHKYLNNSKGNLKKLAILLQSCIEDVHIDAIIHGTHVPYHQIPISTEQYNERKIAVYYLEHKRY